MHRVLLLLCLIVAIPAARAADSATSGPNADTTPLQQASAVAQPADCPMRPQPTEGGPSNIIVELDPDTLWRPRGAEVRFTILGAGAPVSVRKVRVCFGWSSPNAVFQPIHDLIGSPQVRSVANDAGATEYGALVPDLKWVPNADWWPRRLLLSIPYVLTGAGTVPVADMVVEVTPTDGPVVVTAIQVGITRGIVAWVVVIFVAALAGLIMYRISPKLEHKEWGRLLWIISTRDGHASLSQLQIVLWTGVVGMSAIYVMTLSGNLISISTGTLTLLGIAGGATLIARIPDSGQPTGSAETAGVPTTPKWSDLIIPDRQTDEIDVTRVQLLAFTMITAAFVLIKVIVDFEIPAIPTNFLVLMGISNGVYVTGRKLSGTGSSGGRSPDAKAAPAGDPKAEQPALPEQEHPPAARE